MKHLVISGNHEGYESVGVWDDLTDGEFRHWWHDLTKAKLIGTVTYHNAEIGGESVFTDCDWGGITSSVTGYRIS